MAGPAKKNAKHERTIAMDVIISKRGDVLLKLSKNGCSAGTLLVSSQVLSLASPVFEAMFNGNFTEGQNFSAASPKEVSLPEDDPSAMTLLCKIVHMQTDLTKQTTFDQLADFAVLCDKYQCTDAVSFWSRIQIAGLLHNANAPSFEKLIFITYVLDLPHEFGEVTLHIVRDRAGTFDCHVASHGLDFVPLVILDHIRKLQNSSTAAVRNHLLPNKYHDLITSDCNKAAGALKLYLRNLADAGIKMEGVMSISKWAERAAVLSLKAMGISCDEHETCAVKAAQNLHEEVAIAVTTLHMNMKSCCLDCMRKKVTRNTNRTCRLGHVPFPVPDSGNTTTNAT